MQVAYFADVLYQKLAAGSGRYAAELAAELCRLPDINLQFLTLYPQEVVMNIAQERGYPVAMSVPFWMPRPIQYLSWHLLGWPDSWAKAAASADIIHTPLLIVPPKRKVPLLVTVHDLTFLSFPEYHTWKNRVVAATGLKYAIKNADAFLAVSHYTKQDLVRLTGIAPSRIFVTPEAADPRFIPTKDSGTLARHGIDRRYILYVGTLEPRKNIGVLLRAFAALEDETTLLVLAGAKGWMYDDFFSALIEMNINHRVRILGYVADEDLPVLYSQAEAFVYPSLFEGFGLPILEAMQCGAPVITTNVSSLPEVAGDAAILVSPTDVLGLTRELHRVLSEPSLCTDMRGASLLQASHFSWRTTAELTAEAYHHLLKQ